VRFATVISGHRGEGQIVAGATPAETDRLVEQAISQQDVEALLELFEPDAVFVDPGSGAGLRGHEEIRQEVTEMFEAKPRLIGAAGPPKVGLR
jgi:ketosteroid isomerase-like protein